MATVQFEISDQKAAVLKAKATKRGVSAEQYVRQIVDRDLDEEAVTATVVTEPRHPISEVIGEIWSDLPDEARAQLPVDGAAQVDHYIYGSPKRNQ